jgi:hypothetical protein
MGLFRRLDCNTTGGVPLLRSLLLAFKVRCTRVQANCTCASYGTEEPRVHCIPQQTSFGMIYDMIYLLTAVA